MTKRRTRAGLLRHRRAAHRHHLPAPFDQHGGICWEQCESPEPAAEDKDPDRYKMGRKSAFDPAGFQGRDRRPWRRSNESERG